MNKKKQKGQLILEILENLFPHPEIPLSHHDPFTLLVAVVLSAQCTDARVNQVTKELFTKGSTPSAMAALSPQEIEKIIQPCGLGKTKAKALWQMSHMLLERYGGQVPQEIALLEKLPGVGHKTASVMMIQAFNTPAFPVDTHIHRCAKRWGLSQGKNVAQTEKDLMNIFPKSSWSKLHLQIIYYARKYCPARAHKKDQCPICSAIEKL